MKSYNIKNYIRYKNDVALTIKRLPNLPLDDYTREELTTKFLPLVENIARKFSTSQQASGVMNIMDFIGFGHVGLVQAIKKLDYEKLSQSEDMEKTLKSFLSKRIKGSIRRYIDMNRGNIRIPEHKINEIRKNFGKDKKMVEMFFNSIFLSIDANPSNEDMAYQIPDTSEPYNIDLLNLYLKGLCQSHLTDKEYQVIRLSYGLDCKKHSATEIANYLGIEGSSSYVRVSQLKRQAVDKLIENVDHSQVLDFL
jgi:RNA polymerase sigma factor (sigma-70 family)